MSELYGHPVGVGSRRCPLTPEQRAREDIDRVLEESPKTLIFAKDDSHAEDIVEIVRDEFGREPASELLPRIRAERASSPQPKPRQRQPKARK